MILATGYDHIDLPTYNKALADHVGHEVPINTHATPDGVKIWCADPDNACTDDQLQAALTVYQPPGKIDLQQEFVDAVNAATTLDELKAALVGTTGPGARANHR